MSRYLVFILLVKLLFFHDLLLTAQKKDIVSLSIQVISGGLPLFTTHAEDRHWLLGGYVGGLSAAMHMQKRKCRFSYQAGIGNNLITFSFGFPKGKTHFTRFHNYPNVFISSKYLFNQSKKYILYSQLSIGFQFSVKKFKGENYEDDFLAHTTYSDKQIGLFLSPEIGFKVNDKGFTDGLEVGVLYRVGFKQVAQITLIKDHITQVYVNQGSYLGFSFRFFFIFKTQNTRYSPAYFRKARCPQTSRV